MFLFFAAGGWLLVGISPPASVLLRPPTDLQNDLRAAAAAEKSGDYKRAAALYQQLLAGAGLSQTGSVLRTHVRTRLATAYFLLHRYGDSLEALAPLTGGKDSSPKVPAQAWLVEGLDYLELNQPSKAIPSLRRALSLNPGSGTARLALGDALARTGRLEEGVREYVAQTRRTPSLPDAWYKLGLAYAERATQISQEFTRQLPESVVAQQLAGEDLLAKGDDQGAAGLLLRLLRRAPSQPQLRADLGAALLELGYPKAAEREFREELSGDSDCPLARLGLAETAALRGDWEEATTGLEQLIGTHPRELARLLEFPPPGLLRRAWKEGKIGLPEPLAGSRAGAMWQAWLADSEERPKMPEENAARSCRGAPSKAMTKPGFWLSEACYQRLRERLKAQKQLTPKQTIKLTEAEFRLGDVQGARRDALRVLASDPRDEWEKFWLSQADGELAEHCFARVASIGPQSARLDEMLAQYYASHHNFPRAKTQYLAAIRLAPDLPDLHLGLGTVYLSSGEWPEAEKEFRTTLDITPGSMLARFHLGDVYLLEHRWAAAAEQLRRALEDPAVALRARLDLAKAESEMGQTRQAIADLRPIMEKDRDGEAHYLLAGLYRKLGEKELAQEALATFKRLHQVSLEADRADLDALEKEQEKAGEPHSPGDFPK